MQQPDEKKEKLIILANDSELADWFLMELLRRLPLKPLFKFKSVSKRWFSLISDPSMRRFYLPRPDAPTYTLLCRHVELADPLLDRITVKIKTHPSLESINIPLGFVPENPENFQLVAAHNGLLLTRDLSPMKQVFYVSNTNPFTAQCIALPAPPNRYYSGAGFIVRSDSTYNLITAHVVGFGNKLFMEIGLNLFDSRTGKWRSSKVSLSHPVEYRLNDNLKPGVLYRGALHWIFYGHGFDSFAKIVVYDPEMHESEGDDYKCRVFDCTPSVNDADQPSLKMFGLSGGELRYAVDSAGDSSLFVLRVWSLKDYDSPEWCLEHEIAHSDLMTVFALAREDDNDKPYAYYLCDFNPIDKDVIYFWLITITYHQGGRAYTNSVVSYNVSTRTAKILCSDLPLACISVLPCVLPQHLV